MHPIKAGNGINIACKPKDTTVIFNWTYIISLINEPWDNIAITANVLKKLIMYTIIINIKIVINFPKTILNLLIGYEYSEFTVLFVYSLEKTYPATIENIIIFKNWSWNTFIFAIRLRHKSLFIAS